MKRSVLLFAAPVLLLILSCEPEKPDRLPAREHTPEDSLFITEAAREIMNRTPYCVLVTLDENNIPQARAMDPFAPDNDLRVWMGTNRKTRKVQQIQSNSRATLFYLEPPLEDGRPIGTVTLIGHARLSDDPQTRSRYWKADWKDYYEDEYRGQDYLLIEFIPDQVQVMSPRHYLMDLGGWRPVILKLR